MKRATPPSLPELIKSTRKFCQHGIPVVPLFLPDQNARSGKSPATPHGVKDATADFAAARTLIKRYAPCNIGIGLGEAARLLCLDIDPARGGAQTLAQLELELGPLPRTCEVSTGGGGRHLYFQHPTFRVGRDTTGKFLGAGVDVLADGSYAVAPPSVHKSGLRYQWKPGHSLVELTPAPLPKKWRRCLRSKGQPGKSATAEAKATTTKSTAVIWAEGTRNTSLTALAGHLRRSGLGEVALLKALKVANEQQCQPPLPSDEVKKIASSVANYPHGQATVVDHGRMVAQQLLHTYYEQGRNLMFVDGDFMAYRDGVWRPTTRQILERLTLELLATMPQITGRHSFLKREVVDLLSALQARDGDPFRRRSSPARVINCANGELWLLGNGDIDFRPHRAESFLEHQIAVAYDAAARCPEYDKAIRKIFGKADDPRAMALFWDELAGYIIQPERLWPLVVVLYGRGSNGKTRLIETTERLLGRDLIYSGRVEDLDKDRFAMGHLVGKRLFVDDDVRSGVKLPDGPLKKISERKLVTGEHKFKAKFQFESRVVPVLVCNNVPSLADLSYGMLRRLWVIPFQRRFTGPEQDPKLFDRLCAARRSR